MPLQIVDANNVIYGGTLSDTVSLGPLEGLESENKVSHMDTPCLCDGTPIKTSNTKAQANIPGWQYLTYAVIHHWLGEFSTVYLTLLRGWLEACTWSLLDSVLCTFHCKEL